MCRRAIHPHTVYPCSMRYTWLFLDADGTLFDYRAAEQAALAESLRQIGVSYQPDHLASYQRYNSALWGKLERGEVTRDVLQSERFRQLLDQYEITADPIAFNDRYLENLGRRGDLIAGARSLLETVRGQVGLLLITNGFSRVQRSRLTVSGLLPLFDSVIISEEVGSAKPDAGIFDAAFNAARRPRRGDVLIVGDSLSSDIWGGINYAIDTCWYNPAGAPSPDGLTPTHIISDLAELEPILSRSEARPID